MSDVDEVLLDELAELQALLARIIIRILKMLTRHGYLIEEQGMTYLAEAEPDNALRDATSRRVRLPHRTRAARRAERAEPANGLQPREEVYPSPMRQRARL